MKLLYTIFKKLTFLKNNKKEIIIPKVDFSYKLKQLTLLRNILNEYLDLSALPHELISSYCYKYYQELDWVLSSIEINKEWIELKNKHELSLIRYQELEIQRIKNISIERGRQYRMDENHISDKDLYKSYPGLGWPYNKSL